MKRVALMISTLFLLLISCDSNRIYEKNQRIPGAAWEQDNILHFETEIDDLASLYNFYIHIRNTTDYKYSNIYFFINTTFPSGEIAHDTLECILADYKGKWLGKGFGKIKESHILFKSRFRFPQQGKYKFDVEHAMRVDTLEGIADIGIRIEKYVE